MRIPDPPLVPASLLLRPQVTRAIRLRRGLGAAVVDGFFSTAARASKVLPLSWPSVHGLEVERDVPYLAGGGPEHRLDVYRPQNPRGPLPVVLYVHGGGFRILSKDTHWLFGLMFARQGYLVFNVGYRLAPHHPFPAAIADVCAAYAWVVAHARAYGGDPSRIALAGESAGANLITALTLTTCYRREEPWARQVFETGIVPRAVLPACGILQVSDPERFGRGRRITPFMQDRLSEVADAYFHGLAAEPPLDLDLADPLCVLERGAPPARPLPAFFAASGTWDPLIDDTRRLERALHRMGVACEARYYPGEPHAFHAFVFRENARRYWRAAHAFLARRLAYQPVRPMAL